MLEEILHSIHNWFVVPDGVHKDTFTVQDGGIVLPFIKNGQYFRIVGSIFNDGTYKYPAADLVDEEFTGEVWALAIPPSFLKTVAGIEAWCEKNPTHSAYLSESFGGYSYTRPSNATTGAPATWQDVFQSELNKWRKMA